MREGCRFPPGTTSPIRHRPRWAGEHIRALPMFTAVLLLSACGRHTLPPPVADAPSVTSGEPATIVEQPEPAGPPSPRPEPPDPRPVVEPVRPPPAPPDDPIVSSPSADEERIGERVDWWVSYWQTRARDRFTRALVRMGRYEDFIDAEIAARGLPPSLRYLPVIEAGYYPPAVSPAGAAGLWQFMPATARWMGLGITPLVDQRFDPWAATPRALDFLAELQKQFKSWFLTLAAYNGGPGRVERTIRAYGGGAPRDDDLFRRIRDRLPAETRDFIPRFLAAARVGSDPGAYGFGDYEKDAPWTFDEIVVGEAVSIDVVAIAAGAPEQRVRDLNPHLVLGLTPAGDSTLLRVPEGTGAGFAERLAAIPADRRVTFTSHSVAAGETLWRIAQNYRVPVSALQAANPDVEPRRMQIGSRLVVPRAGPVPRPAGSDGSGAERPADPRPSGGERVHTVKRGDTLWGIARLYDVELDRLLAHNDLDADTTIWPGDEIRIPRGDR
ncbi:MAG: LysM peptidoglycan-binding domain-containing protein [Gemmatimonadetes bacterium]|nr:LysM peptidoglycan-binding domain-containing protein [Gemmatimonadota bacterium]